MAPAMHHGGHVDHIGVSRLAGEGNPVGGGNAFLILLWGGFRDQRRHTGGFGVKASWGSATVEQKNGPDKNSANQRKQKQLGKAESCPGIEWKVSKKLI